MCSSPVTVPTRKRYLSDGDKALLQVPCGHCAECHSSAVLQLHIRSYFESLDVLDAGGFMWFDTLTYNDNYLPHINDFCPSLSDNFSCFDNSHLTLALKRLRKYYKYPIRYLILPEYGDDDKYTHRPHYHCLFFVYGGNGLDFAHALQRAWFYGFTDYSNPYGKNYNNLSHFYIDKRDNSNRVVGYITKYVSKTYSFLNIIYDRLQKVKEIDKTLYRRVLPRRRLSLGYGLSGLLRCSTSILDYDSLSYVEGTKPIVYNLSGYYLNSLYKYLCKSDFERLEYRYKPIPETLDFLLRKIDTDIDNRVNYYLKYFNRIPQYVAATGNLVPDVESLLNGRTFRDLAVYDLFYRNRLLLHPDCFIDPVILVYNEFIKTSDFHSCNDFGLPDKCFLISDSSVSYTDALHNIIAQNSHSSVVNFRYLNYINDSFSTDFANFDFILSFFDKLHKYYAKLMDGHETTTSILLNQLKKFRL